MPETISLNIPLNGTWKFKTDPENLGECYPEELVRSFNLDCRYMDENYDDSAWNDISVPACWQAQGFQYNGAAWYRRRFDLPASASVESMNSACNKVLGGGKRFRLRFLGVDYFADVWINGFYLGSHEGYFAPFEFDVTEFIKPRDNLLVVRVDSPNDIRVKHSMDHEQKTLIKGALQDWDVNNLEVNPGGIWNDVELIVSNDIYIEKTRVDTEFELAESDPGVSDPDVATILATIDVFSAEGRPGTVCCEIKIQPANFQGEPIIHKTTLNVPVAKSRHTITIELPNPKLWWTWDLGTPNLYDIEVTISRADTVLDRFKTRFGIRKLSKGEGWATFLNGKRIFWRGSNYLSDQLLSNMDRARYERDVRLAREANMNMLRTFCVVEKPEFYDLCDELGILVYQDFPMQWRMARGSDLVRRAIPQMRDMVDLLYNHPSVAIWCFGSEPGRENFEKLGMALATECRRYDQTRLVQQANEYPNHWDILALKDKYKWDIDFHYYSGWYWGPVEELHSFDKAWFEVVTEYGAQALPCRESLERFIPEEDLWPPKWRTYKHHCFQEDLQLRWIPKPENLDQFIEDSQRYQAFFLKYHTEFYRKMKFQPCNGALQFCFNDCWPAVTWSVVDYYRKPKPGYYALKQAFSPIHVIADWPSDLAPGEPLDLGIYIVNDYLRPFPGLIVECRLLYRGSDKEQGEGILVASRSFLLDVAENSIIPGQRFHMEKLNEVGFYKLELTLKDENRTLSTNAYEFKVDPGVEKRDRR
ncbi:MAG TPA: hypothetical protein GXX51_07845 [Firmicutes bacterium]|nr:hypothetical protein [Bacillota bacterium]